MTDGKDEPEVLSKNDKNNKEINANVLAQFNQYSERPDLFLNAIEEHSPGFIKSLTNDIVQSEKKNNEIRYSFGKRQAYTGMFMQILSGVGAVVFLGWSVYTNSFTFTKTIGLVIWYAVSQGGVSGFLKVINAMTSWINKNKQE